jgi:hypothetical protein
MTQGDGYACNRSSVGPYLYLNQFADAGGGFTVSKAETKARATRWFGRSVAIAGLALAAGVAASHDQPGSTEFVTPLPQQQFFGEIFTGALVGPENGSEILHATLELTWIPDPNMPASDLGIEFGIPTTGGTLHWMVTGAELGWDDGPGPFQATIGTDDVNGEVFWPLPPNSIIHLDLFTASGTGGVWGQFQDSSLTFEIAGEAPTPVGSVPDGDAVPGLPLTVAKGLFGTIVLEWDASCSEDPDFEIYEGELGGNFTSHQARFCTTDGLTTKGFAPIGASAYYLVVPTDGAVEGSYGRDSDGDERGQGVVQCAPQLFADCP